MHYATPIRVNSTQTLHKGPVLLTFYNLSGDGAAADADLHDGINEVAPRKFHLEAANGDSATIAFAIPVLFLDGLHIVVNATTTFITVGIIPLSRESLAHFIAP